MNTIVKDAPFKASSRVLDITEFLSDEYKDIIDLFDDFKRVHSALQKQKIVFEVLAAIRSILKIEADYLYPEIKKILKERGMISAAIMNHTVLRYLMSEIESIDADSDIYDIKVKVFAEHISGHFKEVQSKIFSQISTCEQLDLWALGAQVSSHKHELFERRAG